MPALEEDPVAREELRDEDRVLVIFAYLGPLAIVSLAATRSEFVRWHAKQGLMLSASAILTFIILRIPHAVFYGLWTFLGDMFLTMELIILTGFLLVAILCMVRALEGERFRLPWVAELVDRF